MVRLLTLLAPLTLGQANAQGTLSCGTEHSCLVVPAGLKCWGNNWEGSLGLPPPYDYRGDIAFEMGDRLPFVDMGDPYDMRPTSVAANDHASCVILRDAPASHRTVYCVGYRFSRVTPDSGAGFVNLGDGVSDEVVQVALGTSHGCALFASGSVECWGAGSEGQRGTGSRANSDAEDNQVKVPLGTGLEVAQIVAGDRHNCALFRGAQSGRVKCWGYGTYGQLGLGEKNNDRGDEPNEMGDLLPFVDLDGLVDELAAGQDHSCARMRSSGAIKCWGKNWDGQLGYGDREHRGDGSGEMGSSLPTVPLDEAAVALGAGGAATCALGASGAVRCWGSNYYGQLGQGDDNDRDDSGTLAGLPPVDVGNGIVEELSVGANHVTARCSFNGKQLKLELGEVAYPGQAVLVTAPSMVLECGVVTALVAPNGAGKSSLAKLVASKTLPGFPQQLTTCYLDSCGGSADADLELAPPAYVGAGLDARKGDLARQISFVEGELDADGLSDEDVEALCARLGALTAQEEELAAQGQSDIASVLGELGFEAAELMTTPVSELSSGWAYKCRLARALVSQPDLLVLDEPSFLDAASVRWMVHRVRGLVSSGAMVCLVSHKESLLEALADRVLFINPNRELEAFNCGYAAFKESKSVDVMHAAKELGKGQAKQADASAALKKVKLRVEKGERNNAKKISGGEDKRWIRGKCVEAKQKGARSAAAKVKQLKKDLGKLEELAKASREHGVQPIVLPGGGGWSPSQQMLSAEDVSFAYRPDAPPLLHEVTLAVYGGDRIAMVGANGQGKSTLLKLLVGQLEPDSGSVHRSSGLRVAYFAQDALQRLQSEQFGGKTPVALLQESLETELQEVEARQHLGGFGLGGPLATLPLRALSAGQRTRLLLATLFPPGKPPPSLLVLDEAENLDADTAAALLESLANFDGAVLCVSHDEAHLAHFAPRQRWEVRDAKVHVTFPA